jgi:2-phospho-L-lactate guanylyltransferase
MDTSPPPLAGDDLASSLDERVAAVVALKTLPAAKSRMSVLPAPLRERLARCLAIDTVSALAPAVGQVLVVSDQPDLPSALLRADLQVRVVSEPTDPEHGRDPAHGRGALNQALAHGDDLLRAEGVQVVLACVGDLPALRTASVGRVIRASLGRPRSFLADHDGRGTTMLIARGVRLNPLYGTEEIRSGQTIGSAVRHQRSGALPLALGELPDARRDVDTLADLRLAHLIGTGPATASMLDPVTATPGTYLSVEVLDRDETTFTVLADGRTDHQSVQSYDGDPALLVPGRRLHAVRVAGALRCWA